MRAPPLNLHGGRPREITGRMVLAAMVAFFAVVIGVNVVMVRYAVGTFGGVETGNAYKAGLAFNGEIAAARAQDSRHWQVVARVTPAPDGGSLVEVAPKDRDGNALRGLEVQAALHHPTDRRHDHAVALAEIRPGLYRGTTATEAGQWDLVLDLSQGGERLFRSKSRVSLH